MPEQGAQRGGAAEAAAWFVVIIQGPAPRACVVGGIEGVTEAVLRAVWQEPAEAGMDEVAALLAALRDPDAWALHGAGDGRPYWHWWFGGPGGSVTVQRLTEVLPLQERGAVLRGALAEAVHALAGCAQELRQLAGSGED